VADQDDPTGLVRRYVRLGLRLDRVAPGLVDAHLGDPAVARAVAAEPRPDPAVLRRDAAALRRELPTAGLDPARTAFLDAQLGALEVVAARADGHRIGVVDEVRACLGVRIGPGDPDAYREAHRALADLLPGHGSLAERLGAFRARDVVAPQRLAGAVEALGAALRARTASAIGLPDGEAVRFEVVDTAPWSGFSHRTGPLGSTVSVNAGVPQRAAQLALLVAHEAYPGHHTDASRIEAALRDGTARFPERELLLARTPQSLVAEGAAELGLEVLLGRGWGPWSAEALRAAGAGPADGADGALAEAVEAAMEGLAEVRQDAVLLLHGRGAGVDAEERALAHLRRWLLVDDDRARRMLAFVAHPRWRIHTTTYVEGVRLLRPWLAARPSGESATVRFARLLDEPWTPGTLRPVDRASPVRHARRVTTTVRRR